VSTTLEAASDRELEARLRRLKLPGIAGHYREIARMAEKEGLTHEKFLAALVEQEESERGNRRVERLLKESKLPREKTLETFDFARVPSLPRALVRTLSEGEFLDRAENVLAFGNPGTGKTHLLCGIGHELVKRGRSVLFTPTFALVQSLVRAKRDLRLAAELKRLDRFDAVLLDDIGYVQQERAEMEVLFTFLSERYERKSVLVTSNLVFSKWEQIFKDSMVTAAAIDRIIHHARIIELDVESFRAAEAHARRKKREGRGGELVAAAPTTEAAK
jgi:DNA replication protein DnaC